MACPPIQTGVTFLYGMLRHIDCQARTIGNYGFGALAEPGAQPSTVLTGLLTIFIAIYGIKLIFNEAGTGQSLIAAAIKVGIVLTLATSWPAWRIIAYDVVLDGPAEIATSIGIASGLDGASRDLATRLQALDDGIVVLTSYGTGRQSGGTAAPESLGNSFEGIALADQFALGIGRTAFLSGTLLPYGVYRLGAGILLAIAPLMAGLLLFAGSAGIFFGWLRGLVFCAIGSLVQQLVQGVQTTLLEPWLFGAVERRTSGAYTPSAPTELLVLSLLFAGITFGLFLLTIRMCFYGGTANHILQRLQRGMVSNAIGQNSATADRPQGPRLSRANIIAQSVEAGIRYDRRELGLSVPSDAAPNIALGVSSLSNGRTRSQSLGSDDATVTPVRSGALRSNRASVQRDQK